MKKEDRENIENSKSFASRMEPFMTLNFGSWTGLPLCHVSDFTALYSQPTQVKDATVGAFPAKLYTYEVAGMENELKVYERYGNVLMVELNKVLELDFISDLGTPSEILPQEIFLENAYAHEYLYTQKGLLITVLQHFNKNDAKEITRFRTFRPIEKAEDLDSELYYPLDNEINW